MSIKLKIKAAIKFTVLAVVLNLLLYFLVTEQGFMYIYNTAMSFSTQQIDITDENYDEYDYLNKVLKKNMLYFVEEIPGATLNYKVLLDNIKFFKNNADIKYIIADVSYTAGEWLNLCLNESDMEKLISTVETYGDDYINSDEFIEFFQNLIDFNSSLETKKRVQIVGIAPENNKTLTKNYIDYLFKQLSSKKRPAEINRVYGMYRTDEEYYYKTMLESLEANEIVYREYFVDKYFNFKMALNNYFNDETDDIDIINDIKTQNFISIFQHNVRSKYYGQFADTSFIQTLKDESEDLSSKIFVDYLVYDNCEVTADGSNKIYRFDFSQDGSETVTLFNNTYMKYVEKYREFVFKINNLRYRGYDTTLGNHLIVLSNSKAITRTEDNSINDNN